MAIPRNERGMTLLELLIAVGIFTLLATALTTLLTRTVRAWRTAEARREAFEEAQTVLRLLRDDLRCAYLGNPLVASIPAESRFLCDEDPEGRRRLTLVRTFPDERRHALAPYAGSDLGATADLDGIDDRKEALEGNLRATGGLQEVLYAMAPGGGSGLYRASAAPIAGKDSLFAVDVVDDPARLLARARLISSRVLHIGFRFHGPTTTGWRDGSPKRPGIEGRSGPLPEWDSTRGLLLPPEDLAKDELHLFRSEASATDPFDDTLPERIHITLVVAEDPPAGPETVLLEALSASGDVLKVEGLRGFEDRLPYVLVGDEWMRCAVKGPRELEIERGGRGQRGTAARAHPPGTIVRTGRTFEAIVGLPTAIEAWRE